MLLKRIQTSLQTNLHALYLVENLREFLHSAKKNTTISLFDISLPSTFHVNGNDFSQCRRPIQGWARSPSLTQITAACTICGENRNSMSKMFFSMRKSTQGFYVGV